MHEHPGPGRVSTPSPEEMERAIRRGRRMRSEMAHLCFAWLWGRLHAGLDALWAGLESVATAAQVVARTRRLAPSRIAAAPARGTRGGRVNRAP